MKQHAHPQRHTRPHPRPQQTNFSTCRTTWSMKHIQRTRKLEALIRRGIDATGSAWKNDLEIIAWARSTWRLARGLKRITHLRRPLTKTPSPGQNPPPSRDHRRSVSRPSATRRSAVAGRGTLSSPGGKCRPKCFRVPFGVCVFGCIDDSYLYECVQGGPG